MQPPNAIFVGGGATAPGLIETAQAALRPDRAGSGNARGHKIYNNVFARCGQGAIVFLHEDNASDGNVFAALPERFGGFAVGDAVQWLDLAGWRAHGWEIEVSSYMDSAMWDVMWEPGHTLAKAWGVLRGHLRRIRDLLRIHRYDLVYVFMWVTPLGTSLFERLAIEGEIKGPLAMGPGGRPGYRYVLYGESNDRSALRMLPS